MFATGLTNLRERDASGEASQEGAEAKTLWQDDPNTRAAVPTPNN